MAEVSIQKVETRYRLPHSQRTEKRRLDQLTRSVVSSACEQAMERLGLSEDSELCLRTVFVPVFLRLNVADKSLVDRWSAAMAEEIADAISKGSTRRAVVYQSRRQALIDMAQSVARGDLRRRWAWRQLGLWQSSGVATEGLAVVELVRSLSGQPEMIVPTLNAIASSGELQNIARRLTEQHWMALAASASSENSESPLFDRPGMGDVPASVLREVLRVVNRSPVFRAIASSLPLVEVAEPVRRSIAVLAILDVEPVLLRSKSASTLINAIAEAARLQTPPDNAESLQLASEEFFVTDSNIEKRTKTTYTKNESDDDLKPIDLRQRAFTRWGGLLFLIPILEDLKLPEVILDHTALSRRNFQWVLHQLALNILDLAPADPAALAFAGLSPTAQPPSVEEEAATEEETAALQEQVTKIVEHLSLLIPPLREIDLIEFVCSRRAEIVADPGWFEVRLSLDEVSTEIRRAGLDLDPGYVSWLGVVVKFVYE